MTAARNVLAQTTLALNLLSGLATDIPLHWLPASPKHTSFPPPLTRALFSLLLRTPAPFESLAAQTALLHAQTLPQRSPAACLGFPADASPELVHAVTQDLLLSACRGDTLLVTGPALTLFADAGPDADDYNNPAPDPRVVHATTHRLRVIRADNLARAIRVFARAFAEPSAAPVLLNLAAHNLGRFLMPLLDHLPDNVAFLPNHLRQAVHSFYASFAAVATEQMRHHFATRLVCSLMRLASVDPSSISPFMHGMADPQIRLHACRTCLVQRFGATDTNPTSPFGVEVVSHYLKISPRQGRHNKAVPPLLTSLLMAWYHTDDDNSFRFHTNPLKESTHLTHKLCSLRDRISSFGASERDENAFHCTVLIIANKITECNS